jgi:hypothetical protein
MRPFSAKRQQFDYRPSAVPVFVNTAKSVSVLCTHHEKINCVSRDRGI